MVACVNHTEPNDSSTTESISGNTNSENQEIESEPEPIIYSNMTDIKSIL